MGQDTNKLIDHYLGAAISSSADILADKPGITSRLTSALYSGMSGWLILGNVFVLIFTALLLWTAFRFFTSTLLEDYVFWGICLILSLQIQVAVKQWLWSQLDHSAIIRELKRTERL